MSGGSARSYRDAFDAEGFVTLPGVLDNDVVARMCAGLWETFLEPSGLLRETPDTWKGGGRLGLTELVGALRPGPDTHQALMAAGEHDVFAPLEDALITAVDQVFGPDQWRPVEEVGGLPMPAFPIPDATWNVPYAAWHADEPTFSSHQDSLGLLVFVFLDIVPPKGGGTMVLAGSPRRLHHLAKEVAQESESADPVVLQCHESTQMLAEQEDWIRDLFTDGGDPEARVARFMTEGFVSAGFPLRVVELTGKPGDITLMDPRALHTLSANTEGGARLVVKLCAKSG